jgi:hypothetical protein
MKRTALTVLSLLAITFTMAQNLTKVKDAITAKKYAEAKTQLDEFINNPKYQKNPELFYLKGKLYGDIVADVNAEKSYPDAFQTSLDNFKKTAEMDKSKFVMFTTLEGSQQIFNLYAIPYNKGVKSLETKEYDKALNEFQQADMAGRFIFAQGIGLAALDTNLTFYTGFSALLGGKEDLAAQYFTKLANINVDQKGFEDVYKNLMIYHFNKNNLTEFEKIRQQGLKLYPKEEYFTYDEVVFINDMKDEADKLKRIEAKVASDPKNLEAISILTEILFDKLLYADSLYPKAEDYNAAESKVVGLYEKMAALSPEDGLIPFNTGLIYVNKGFKINNNISDVNDKIRKFNEAQKPDKTGKIPPPPKDLTTLREDLRAKQQIAFDLGLPYLLKAQPLVEKKSGSGRGELQNYKKLLDILIEVYSSKRQAAKLPADKAKYEAEEAKWNKEYDRINNAGK